MSAEARANGWHGFERLGERVEGGYRYVCDGMPTPMGCGAETITTVPLARVGVKKASGWLVTYGLDDDGTNDKDVVLTFCPKCRAVVEAHEQPKDQPLPAGNATSAMHQSQKATDENDPYQGTS